MAGVGAGALDGVLDGVGGQDAEDDRDLGLRRDLGNAFARLGSNVVKVRRRATNDRPEADDRIELLTVNAATRDGR